GTGANKRLASAGRPLATATVRIVDPLGRDAPAGAVGEIAVRGPQIMLGYWKRPQETDAAIRDGWLHTGDAGHMDKDGYLFVVDRVKDMIISGGENVYSAEVEEALAKMPQVAASAVVAAKDADWGERVHAFVVSAPDATPTLAEIQDHCRSLIAGYKIPRSITIVEALPLSPAGKVLKHELRARLSKNSGK
ncbi:class I adenylate-forming enzyme family protein, partial [Rhizobiaceae sp. 2RAB30]